MKKKSLIIASLLSFISIAWAAETIWIHQLDNIALGLDIKSTENITLSNDGSTVNFNLKDNAGTHSFNYSEIQKVTLGKSQNAVTIAFNGTDAEILNPYGFEGVTVTRSNSNVTINSTATEEVRYEISGTAANGSITINSSSPFTLALNGASISNSSFSAININSSALATIELVNGTTSTLVDGDEGANGCIFSTGSLKFTGNGTLNITGNTKHAIACEQAIEIASGTINVVSSLSDGLHSTTSFVMNDGTVNVKSIGGDAIDGDTGTILINGGTLNLEVTAADKKGVKSDDKLTVNGGDINITMPADQGKAFRTKANMEINGGNIIVNASGNVVVTANDPSYCSIVKATGTFTMTNGTLKAVHTGTAGKGISADGNIIISGGNISLEVSGANGTYTNTTSDLDSYSATCISTDADINISGGTIVMIVKGDQAKGFKSNGSVYITGGNIAGTLSGNAAVINDNPSYCTLIKSDMDFTISDGTIIATHTGVGGKGISADGTLTVNGGIIDITTSGKSETYTSSTGTGTYKSTCVTSDGKLIIKNGYVKAVSATNYAIGSNTAIEISGGITLACGIADSSTSDLSGITSVSGGTFINASGNMHNLTATQCSANTVKYASNISAGTLVTITDSSDNHIISFKAPQAMSQGCSITHPGLKTGASYKLYTGGSVSGGTVIDSITQAGTFSGGDLAKSFKLSSNFTSL